MIQRCHALPGKPCGRTIAWAVRKHKDDLPSDIVDIISWYAVNDPDPALGHRSIWPVDPGDARSHLLDEGLNSTRGAAADAIATLISSQPQYIGRLESSLRSLVQDPSIAVRAWASECLVALLQPNRRLSIELFFTLVDADDELLSSRFVETFLNHALRTHLSILKPSSNGWRIPTMIRLVRLAQDERVLQPSTRLTHSRSQIPAFLATRPQVRSSTSLSSKSRRRTVPQLLRVQNRKPVLGRVGASAE